jgi:glc operon protein GlcG
MTLIRKKVSALIAMALLTAISFGQEAPPPNPLDVIADEMPFHTPYGPPISFDRAQAAAHAAMEEAAKHGWAMNIAVVDSGANLINFIHMDNAQLASIAIAQHKARTSVKFRRPTKYFEDAIQKSGYQYILTLDDVVASRGGIPLIENGKIVGAIGCSGGSGAQDEAVCTVGAKTIGK